MNKYLTLLENNLTDMGLDIVPLALHHKIDTSSYGAVAAFLTDAFQSNVTCVHRYENEDFFESYRFLGRIVKKHCRREIRLVEFDSEDGKQKGYNVETQFFPFGNPFGYGGPGVEFTIYPDIIEMFLIGCPFRWFRFCDTLNGKGDGTANEVLRKYRDNLYSYFSLFGAKEIMFIPDQYDGELLWDTVQEFKSADFIREYASSMRFRFDYDPEITEEDLTDCVNFDYQEYLKSGIPLLSDGKWANVIFDDFSDYVNREKRF